MTMGELERFREALAEIAGQVSVGYRAVHVFSPAELDGGQVGYARDPKGRDLTGGREGDWRKSWIVCGYEDMCGDPVFVDLAELEWPVFTAAHGGGAWEPILIAKSFRSFCEALAEVGRLSKGWSSPAELEEHPLTEKERGAFVKHLG